MSKANGVPQITIFIRGGIIQNIDLPKDPRVEVLVKDYDCDIEVGSEEAKHYNIKEDENGTYEEGIWQN